jgi:hypothetical protein
MGMFDDPVTLRKALDLALTDELKLSELRYLFGAAGRPGVAPVLFAWEKENWAKLTERLPGSYGRGMLVAVAADLCDPQARDDAKAFFVQATQSIEGIKRDLDEALERSALCIALHERYSPEVAKYFTHK